MKSERLVWTTPAGNVHDLDSEGITLLWGQSGAHMPPVRIVRHTVAGQAGTVLQLVEADLRSYAVPAILEAADEAGFRAMVGRVARIFDPTHGPGTFHFIRGDGTHRDLSCICVAGLGFTEAEDVRGPGWQETVLEFEADDPWWYGTVQSQTWSADVPATDWFPLLPLSLGASNVIGVSTISIDSDSEVFPVWEVYGPGTSAEFVHTVTGRRLAWSGTLAAGDVLTIDTAHGTVTLLEDGETEPVSAFPGLTAHDFWPFLPGVNPFELAVASSDAATKVVASWRERFYGP